MSKPTSATQESPFEGRESVAGALHESKENRCFYVLCYSQLFLLSRASTLSKIMFQPSPYPVPLFAWKFLLEERRQENCNDDDGDVFDLGEVRRLYEINVRFAEEMEDNAGVRTVMGAYIDRNLPTELFT